MTGILITLGPGDVLAAGGRETVARHAGTAPESVVAVDNLVRLAYAKETDEVTDVLARDREFAVGCSRPRAVRALLDFAGVDVSAARITWIQVPCDPGALRQGYGVPWFPVIDRARCTGCGTCADYCLFSVYATDAQAAPDQRVRVVMPQYCKIGCPACARLCPSGALIFPFCHEPELNGGIADPPPRSKEESLAALGDDPMRILAERKSRRRLIDPVKFEQAEQDRITFSGVL